MIPPDGPEAHQRLLAMEERLTFQQRTIEELNGVVLSHDRRLEQLSRELGRIAGAMGRLADALPGEELPHEKPPHY